jgi:hypothetical protein
MSVQNSLCRFVKACLLTTLTLALSACGSVQLAYNYAPNLIAYRMNGYFNLDEKQQVALDQELATFSTWHEENALPQYTKLLNQWAKRVASDQPYEATEILALQETVEQQLQIMGTRASAQLAPLMMTLGPQQLRQLQSKLDDSNKDYFSDYLNNADSPKAIKKQHSRVVSRFEDWLGTLSPAQQKILTTVSDARKSMLTRWDAERKLRQTALITVLSEHRQGNLAQAQTSLHTYLKSLNQYREPVLNAQRDALRLEWAQATADILNSATPAQKIFLQKKLVGYAQDFVALTPKRIAQAQEK